MEKKWWIVLIIVVLLIGGGIAWYLLSANEGKLGVACDLESCFERQRQGYKIICSCPWN